MINIPEEIKYLYRQDSISKNFRVSFVDGSYDDLVNKDIVSESVIFTESISSDKVLKFGAFEKSSIEFNTYFNHNIKGKHIFCATEIDISSLSEEIITDYGQTSDDVPFVYFRIPYGYFLVETCEQQENNNTRRIVAYQDISGSFKVPDIITAKLKFGSMLAQYTDSSTGQTKLSDSPVANISYHSLIGSILNVNSPEYLGELQYRAYDEGYIPDSPGVADGVSMAFWNAILDESYAEEPELDGYFKFTPRRTIKTARFYDETSHEYYQIFVSGIWIPFGGTKIKAQAMNELGIDILFQSRPFNSSPTISEFRDIPYSDTQRPLSAKSTDRILYCLEWGESKQYKGYLDYSDFDNYDSSDNKAVDMRTAYKLIQENGGIDYWTSPCIKFEYCANETPYVGQEDISTGNGSWRRDSININHINGVSSYKTNGRGNRADDSLGIQPQNFINIDIPLVRSTDEDNFYRVVIDPENYNFLYPINNKEEGQTQVDIEQINTYLDECSVDGWADNRITETRPCHICLCIPEWFTVISYSEDVAWRLLPFYEKLEGAWNWDFREYYCKYKHGRIKLHNFDNDTYYYGYRNINLSAYKYPEDSMRLSVTLPNKDSGFVFENENNETYTIEDAEDDNNNIEKTEAIASGYSLESKFSSPVDIISAWLEIHARYMRFNRTPVFSYDILSIDDLIGLPSLYPSNDLYPSDDLYPFGLNVISSSTWRKLRYDVDCAVIRFSKVVCKVSTEDKSFIIYRNVKNSPQEYVIEETEYDLSNNWIINNFDMPYNMLQDILKLLAETLVKVQYHKVNMNLRALPYIESGDFVSVFTKDNGLDVVVLRHRITGVQSLIDDIESR